MSFPSMKRRSGEEQVQVPGGIAEDFAGLDVMLFGSRFSLANALVVALDTSFCSTRSLTLRRRHQSVRSDHLFDITWDSGEIWKA